MEQEVVADADGIVRRVEVSAGDTVEEGQVLMVLAAGSVASQGGAGATADVQHGAVREDLTAVTERHAVGLDAARADAVNRRHERGRRTARGNPAQPN